jgi:hypothetical protein
MKRALAVVPFLFALVLLPTPAKAGGDASVTFVNLITYDADTDFPLTLCIDGTLEESDMSTTESIGPVSVSPGDHLIEFYQSDDCTGSLFASGNLGFDPNEVSTVTGWWGSNSPAVSKWIDDADCVPAGVSRFIVRNVSAAGLVDVSVTPEGGSPDAIITSLSEAGQQTADLAPGPYDGGEVTQTVGGALVVELGPDEVLEGESRVMYLFGGADGSVGTYFTVSDQPCEPPDSSSSTTTTTTGSAGQAVQPRFTG